MTLVELSVRVPLFFAEACGYRGSARFVALRWIEPQDEIWITDNGHSQRGKARLLNLLWRQDGGRAALTRYRIEAAERGQAPWLVIDRSHGTLLMGSAAEVHRTLHGIS